MLSEIGSIKLENIATETFKVWERLAMDDEPNFLEALGFAPNDYQEDLLSQESEIIENPTSGEKYAQIDTIMETSMEADQQITLEGPTSNLTINERRKSTTDEKADILAMFEKYNTAPDIRKEVLVALERAQKETERKASPETVTSIDKHRRHPQGSSESDHQILFMAPSTSSNISRFTPLGSPVTKEPLKGRKHLDKKEENL